MKRYFIPILVILVLASGLVVGCGQEVRSTPVIQPDVPTRTQDEVCALVYDYLETKGSLISAVPYRMDLLDALGKARPHFQAVYQGNGKWVVAALGQWNLYEASGVIEPIDDDARGWLRYIQYWTR